MGILTRAGELAAVRSRLEGTLFVEAPPAPRRRPQRIAVALGLAAVGVVAILLRLGFETSLDSLWAEDGAVLLATPFKHGFLAALGTLYQGNLILVQRMVGELASIAPLSWAPAVFAIVGDAIVVGSAAIVWVASAGHIRNPYLRGALVALAVVVPVAGLESVNNTDYVAFYMLFATFWLLLWRPRSTRVAVAAGAFALLTTLSTPLGAVLIPIALLRLAGTHDRRDAIITVAFLGGALIQLGIDELNRSAAPNPGWDWLAVKAYVQRVVAGAPLGLRLAGQLWEASKVGFLALGAAFAATVGVAALRIPSRRARYFLVLAVALSVATFLISAYVRGLGAALAWPSGSYRSDGARYAIVPTLLLVSAVLVLLDLDPRPTRLPTWTGLRILAVTMLGVAALTSFSVRNTSARGEPQWSSAIDHGRDACRRNPGRTVSLSISPPGWRVAVPCSRL